LSKKLSDYYKNFETQIEKIAQNIKNGEAKPKLLLHSCCAPCSSAVLEKLMQYFDITIFFYNPNIYPQAEYLRRKEELYKFLPIFLKDKEPVIIELLYEPKEFYDAIKNVENFENMKEKNERCFKCYKLRLMRCAKKAFEQHFDYFTTTLSISPHKDAERINEEGKTIENLLRSENPKEKIPEYLFADFKKKNGFKRSLELSEKYGLYRQDYCGCIYSREQKPKDNIQNPKI